MSAPMNAPASPLAYDEPAHVTLAAEHFQGAPRTGLSAFQIELPLGSKMRRSPERKAEDCDALVRALADGAHRTAAQLCAVLGWQDCEDNKRYVRKLASMTPAVLSHPGSEGYVLERFASAEEIYRSGDAFIDAGKKLIARGIERRRLAGLRRAADVLTRTEGETQRRGDAEERH